MFETLHLKGAAKMAELGERLAQQCAPWRVVFLSGDLGAGKTTLVQAWLGSLGVEGAIKSPTFSMVEPYLVEGREVFHFDLYRLSAPSEFIERGLDDYFSNTSLCLIEWPERAEQYLPKPDLSCKIVYADEHSRDVQLCYG